jgi:hypothetical protein
VDVERVETALPDQSAQATYAAYCLDSPGHSQGIAGNPVRHLQRESPGLTQSQNARIVAQFGQAQRKIDRRTLGAPTTKGTHDLADDQDKPCSESGTKAIPGRDARLST